MEPEFITYQKFNDVGLANALAEQLESHGIAYTTEEESKTFDPTFAFDDPMTRQFSVKIKSEDFEKVNQLLKQDEAESISEIDKDYYLFSFSNDELMEIITKADEWSAFDNVLARKLLTERGIEISDITISNINKDRIEELKAPEPSQTFWIVVGYVFAVCGGVLGFFMGWHLSTYKKTLPDGERLYAYTERDRWHGRLIFYVSIVAFIAPIVYRIFYL